MRPIAFMIMPFGQKRPDVEGENIPDLIDFDQLWEEVFEPLLARSYTPIRADQDFGPLIIVDMIQRLAAADLVLAEVTLANANAYWEVGVRHAARETGCVLVAADWAEPSFDLAQIRQLRYPLPESPLTAESRAAALATIAEGFEDLATSSSPVFQAVPGFPNPDPTELASFRDFAREMSDFHDRITEIRRVDTNREANTAALVADYPPETLRSKAVVWQIIRLVRDHLGWEELLDYLDHLPEGVRYDSDIEEQRFLAIAKTGNDERAAIRLESMIDKLGQTGERCGILGGRFKELWRNEEPHSPKAAGYLRRAIDAYENGMYADLNEYYCASNLPRLYRSLDPLSADLSAKAGRATAITLAACHRAIEFGRGDEWLRPTLLATAFEEGELQEARRLVVEISADDPVKWQLESVIKDLHTSLAHHPDDLRAELEAELRTLEARLGPNPTAPAV